MKALMSLMVVGVCLGSGTSFAEPKILSVTAEATVTRTTNAESKAIKNAKADARRLATEACEDSPKAYWGLGENFERIGSYKIQSNCIYNVPYGGCVFGVASVTLKYTCNEK